jgi:hypothetical protein
MANYELGSDPSPDIEPISALILVPDSMTVSNKFLLFVNHPV